MTNLLATIFFTITTNWTTVSTTIPGDGQSRFTWGNAPTQHQVGTVSSNTIARIHFEGREIDVELKREEIGTVSRDWKDPNYGLMLL